jgi:hypothetical protein
VEADNCNIKASGLKYRRGEAGKGNRFELTSDFGLIELTLPAPPSFRLDASTDFGTITSDFQLSGVKKGLTAEECRCQLGDGLAEIVLEASHGNITIKQEQSMF